MVVFQTNPIIFSVIGGIILGIATSLNYSLRGKVTGMSGIIYGIVSLNKNELPEKLTMFGGIMFIASLFYLIFKEYNYFGFQPFGLQSQITVWTTYPGYALAGFLVGFGTKLSNGCTSGHGLCGMARLSLRSFVAVATFLLTALAIGTLSYQINGFGPFSNDNDLNPQNKLNFNHTISSIIFLVIGLILPIIGFIIKKKTLSKNRFQAKKQFIDQLIVFIVGIIFSIGLMTSGMTRRVNILGFLEIGKIWNPQLMFVLASGLFFNFVVFQYMIRVKKVPFLGEQLFNPQNNHIDWKLVFGAFCFGLGWAIGGICPGPWIALLPTFTVGVSLIWGVSMILGQVIASKIDIRSQDKKNHQQQHDKQQSINSQLIKNQQKLEQKH